MICGQRGPPHTICGTRTLYLLPHHTALTHLFLFSMKGDAAVGLRDWRDFILAFEAEYLVPQKASGEAKNVKKAPPIINFVRHNLFGDMFGLGK